MRSFKRWIVASVSIPAVLAAAPALAEAAGGADTGTAVEEVVVTAFKRTETVQQAPAAISALTDKALQERGIEGVEDIQYAVPSLQAGKQLGTTAIAIRGVGLNQGSPGVAVHTDGVYQPRPAMGDLAQTDLERVEVLRGPQGTLYGRNANGGAVNFITKAPTDKFEGYVQGSAATYSEYHLTGVVNVPVSDRIRTRLVVNYWDRSKGFVKNIANGPDVDKGNSLSGRLRVDIDITDQLKLDLNISALHDEGPTSYFVLANFPSAAAIAKNPYLVGAQVPLRSYVTTINNRSDFNRSYGGAAATLTWDPGPVQFKSITSISRFSDEFHTDSDGTNLDAFPQTNRNQSHVFTQELNGSTTVGPLSLVAGVYFMNDRAPTYLHYDFPLGISPLPPGATLNFNTYRYQTKATAVFADGTFRINDKLRLIGGARYSVDKQETAQRNTFTVKVGANTFETVTCPLQTFDKKFESFTPRGGVQYDIDSHKNVYATISRGFKAGGFNASACGQNFSPEKITAYETGFKSRFFDNTVTFNTAAFYYDYTDLQLQQVVGLTGQITNAAAAKVRGIETEVVWTPDEHWTLNANGSLLKATYSDFVNVDSLNAALGPQDVSGNYLNNAPKRSANVGVAYKTDISGGGRITARADVSYRSKIYFREFNLPLDSQSAYTLMNLALIWDSPDSKYRVRVFGNNIFDKGYITRLGSSDNFGSRYVTFGTPRQVGVEVRTNF